MQPNPLVTQPVRKVAHAESAVAVVLSEHFLSAQAAETVVDAPNMVYHYLQIWHIMSMFH